MLLPLAILVAPACAVVQTKDYPEHRQELVEPFRGGEYQRTADLLRVGRETIGPDRLVFLLDSAIAYQHLGNFQRSKELLWEAAKLTDIRDFAKATELRSGATVNTKLKFYHGEEFESAMVHIYLSINQLFLGEALDSVNEVREAQRIFAQIKDEAKRTYSVPSFFERWAALGYERAKNFQAASLELDRLIRQGKSTPLIASDRRRLSILMNREDEFANEIDNGKQEIILREAFRNVRDQSSVIVLIQNGYIPTKEADPEVSELARLRQPYKKFLKAHLFVGREKVGESESVLDITKLAQENAQFKRGQWEADRANGFVTREARIAALAKRQPGNGNFGVSDRTVKLEADLRQWATLPAEFQIARVNVHPGAHRISLRMEMEEGRLGPFRDLGEVVVKQNGEMHFLSYRATH